MRRVALFASRLRFPRASSLSAPRALSTSIFNPTPEHEALRDMVRGWTEEHIDPQATEFNRAETFNHDLFKRLGDLGLLGITVDTKYGGSGLDATAAVIAHEEMSAADPAFTLSYLAHSMLFTHNLAINGNDEQCQRFLPDACSGKRIGGMGMSEPWAGTDVLGMKTNAVKDGSDYIINGGKMWITNGCVNDKDLGDMFLVYAKTGSGSGAKSVSLFLIEKGMPGFKLGQKIKDKCGMRASATAELVFEDVRVPAENLVGEEGGAVLCMMRNLEIERLALAAMSSGIARRCIEVMNKYGVDRKAFGKGISSFGQIQRHIADSYAEYMASKCYIYQTAANLKLDSVGNRIDSDGVKLFASVMAKNVADRAMQTLGGNGYVGEYNVERLWRDAKLLEIGGGTLEAHQKNMTKDLQSLDRLQ